MSSSPRWTAVGLLGAIAACLWTISARLEAPADAVSSLRADTVESPAAARGTARAVEGASALLFGLVRDPAGAPIPGARVALGARSASTDGDGRFQLPHSRDTLEIVDDAHFPARVAASVHKARASTAGAPFEIVLLPAERIAGKALDATGAGISGVRVLFCADGDSPCLEALSDAGGAWSSPLLAPGVVQVLFRHPRFEPADRIVCIGSVERRDRSAPPQRLEVTLAEGEPLAVRVIDAAGTGLGDAQVWLETEHEAARTVASRVLLGRTGDLGELQASRPRGHASKLAVELAGFRPAKRAVDGQSLELVLRPAPFISAQAIDVDTGLPVTPTRVELEVLEDADFLPSPHRGLLYHSLADGRIRAGLPPRAGTYRLRVASGAELHGTSGAIEFDGETAPAPVLVRLEHRIEIRGSVHAESGPVAAADVRLVEAPAGSDETRGLLDGLERLVGGTVIARARTASDGRFRFDVLPQGRCQLLVEHPGFAPFASAPMELGWSTSRELPIVLRPGASISGRVLAAPSDDGGAPSDPPLAGSPVLLLSERWPPRIAWTDAAGNYRFSGVAPGPGYEVVLGDLDSELDGGAARARHGGAGASPRIDVAEGEAVVADLRAPRDERGALIVRVTLDGRPYACDVAVTRAEGGATKRASTDALGTLDLGPLAAGSYRLEGAGVAFRRDVEVVRSKTTEAAVELTGVSCSIDIVAGSDASALATADGVAELRVDGARLTRSERIRGGRVRFDGLAPGRYVLRLTLDGRAPLERTFVLDSDRSERVAIEASRAPRLRLRTREGQLFDGRVEIVIESGGELVHRGAGRVEAGRLRLPLLRAGDYDITIRSADLSWRRRLRLPD